MPKAIVTHHPIPTESNSITTRVEEYDGAVISVGEELDLIVIAAADQSVVETFDPGTWSHAEVTP